MLFVLTRSIYFVQQHQGDAVFRKHQGRKNQMRKGKRIGPNDRLVIWHKPKTRPKGLSKEEFAQLPSSLILREVHYYIIIPGFRTKQVTLITTLLDAQAYPVKELVKIYEARWDVELDLKHIKTTLGMDILRGKTPEMVRKEIYIYLLAYNLLRTVMWQAGTRLGVNPLRNAARRRRKLSVEAAGEPASLGSTCAGEKLLSTLSSAPQPLSPSASLGKKQKFLTEQYWDDSIISTINFGGNKTIGIYDY